MLSVSILGSTGSVGTQTLDVIDRNSGLYKVFAISGHSNTALLARQIKKFRPKYCVITDKSAKPDFLSDEFPYTKLLFGAQHLDFISAHSDVDTVIVSTTGLHSLGAVISAIDAGKRVALANKEVLVAAGGIIMAALGKNSNARLIPVDSEHSAIFQCLNASGKLSADIRRLILTASGGPFRDTDKAEFDKITPEQALRHPNWSMGNKITVDSATLMNKGLEVIEASFLFGQHVDNIECVVHYQSIIHSMVEFCDGSVIAQMSYPTMEIPISLALSYPGRLKTTVKPLDFSALRLDFMPCDTDKFPCLELAYSAARAGGGAPAVLSSANDAAVDLFLKRAIKFTDIPKLIEGALNKVDTVINIDMQSVYYIDKQARDYVVSTAQKF